MFYRSFQQLVFPMVLIAVVGAVWIAAWSESLQAEAQRGVWPALSAPRPDDQFSSVAGPMSPDNSLPHTSARDSSVREGSTGGKSLQQVFLEHDQVVGVR
jgi:hypothetical protein